MFIVFNDGCKPYHNTFEVAPYDGEMLAWIRSYANRYMQYEWFEFIEYLLINLKSGKVYRGKIDKCESEGLLDSNSTLTRKVG
jgi:hypothetical protein